MPMRRIVRLAGVLVAAVVALAAGAAAMVPLILKQHRIDQPPAVFAGSTSLLAVPVAGGTPRPVLTLHGQWEFPVATADGKALLLERPALTRTALWRVPLDGASPKLLGNLTSFRELAWSPDQTRYATWDATSLVIDRANGTRIRTLARPNGGWGPAWSGHYISAELQLRPGKETQRDELAVWRPDGTLVWRTILAGTPGPAAVSPDGTRVVALSLHGLELITKHGSRQLASNVEQGLAPEWTPNGRGVVYWDAEGRLVLRLIATNRLHVITRAAYPGLSYGLSPDGKTVYLTRLNEAVNMPK